MNVLRPLLLAALAASLAPAQGPAPGYRVAAGVEPHVAAAFAAAWARLPEPWRARLGDVELARARALGVPDDAPLEYRLLGRAAMAFFESVRRRIVVTDAGAAGRATWGGAAPTEREVGELLVEGRVFGEREFGSIEEAWAEFVRAVLAWDGAVLVGPTPPVGDPALLDRFLERGVWRALGGRATLEELLFHELAHAVQNELGSMGARMASWATLSGWRDADDGEPSDGFSGGGFAMERPAVLIRLLFDSGRGAGIYAPSAGARFVDRYGRFDLREDYAECARLMAFDPDALAAVAPEKLLYLNALGWNARLDGEQPGPLWIGAAELQGASWRAGLAAGAARLLADDDGTGPDPRAVAAVMRAHAGVFRAAELPPAFPPIEPPEDLPPVVRRAVDGRSFTFEVDGVARQPAPRAVRAEWDRALATWWERREFDAGLELLAPSGVGEVRQRYREAIAAERDADVRAQEFGAWVEVARGVLPAGELRRLVGAEVAFHREAGRRADAARFAIEVGGDAELAGARRVRDGSGASHGAVELAAAIARTELRRGDRRRAWEDARRIPGRCWGAWRRVALLTEIAAADGELPEGADPLGDAAAAADGAELAGVRRRLLWQVVLALRDAGREDEARRVAGMR